MGWPRLQDTGGGAAQGDTGRGNVGGGARRGGGLIDAAAGEEGREPAGTMVAGEVWKLRLFPYDGYGNRR